ncbi:MAG: VTT domain-containing protein, partial [Chloroflexi bacterium]|nr:VTT domain-containing protein [Chloroflexota bacterium]
MVPSDSTGEHASAVISKDRWVRFSERYTVWVRIATVALVVGVVILGTVLFVMDRLTTESIGFPSIWVISFIGAGAIFLPVPGMLALCIGASPDFGLNPIQLGLLVASAETLGEMTGYLAGISGAGLLERNRWYTRFKWWLNRRGGVPLFILATIPNPLFDLLGIAAGAARYPVHKFIGIVFVGKSIKSTAIAYSCFW